MRLMDTGYRVYRVGIDYGTFDYGTFDSLSEAETVARKLAKDANGGTVYVMKDSEVVREYTILTATRNM